MLLDTPTDLVIVIGTVVILLALTVAIGLLVAAARRRDDTHFLRKAEERSNRITNKDKGR